MIINRREQWILHSNLWIMKRSVSMKRKRMLALILAAGILFTCFPAKNAQAARFKDISGHWAYDYIIEATDRGFFSGTSSTTFSPDMMMTRAMFVTVLASYSGENISAYNTTKFKDVPKNAWYAHAVAWAYRMGITAGISETKFGPDQQISREQIAVLMIQFANYQQFVLPRVRGGKLFADSGDCSGYALDPVYALYRAGIINGVNGSDYHPQGKATRAEAAVILCKYADAAAKKPASSERIPLISHRGYSTGAPENTMPAFTLSVQRDYQMIETDVRFTRDDVPVLIHDTTIDRTSNGSGKVSEMTYEQLKAYDFSYVDGKDFSAYRGTCIPTFEEFAAFCAKNDVHPFIELKQEMTQAQIHKLTDIATKYGIQYRSTWISFQYDNLKYVKSSHPQSALCLLTDRVTSSALTYAAQLKNTVNTVSVGANEAYLEPKDRAKCLRKHIPLCVWTVDDVPWAVTQTNTCAQYITTNGLTWGNLYR